MQAIKLNAHVDRDRKLLLQLPDEVPEGDVEVIVLAQQRVVWQDRKQHLEALLGKLAASSRTRLSKAQIDDFLAQERTAWERVQAVLPPSRPEWVDSPGGNPAPPEER